MAPVNDYRDLVVWQKAMTLAESVYSVALLLPDTERFGLAAQLRRAAVSVPSNIAEGHERHSRADYRRFITIACGSVAELGTQLQLAQRIYKIDSEELSAALSLMSEVSRMLHALERTLRNVGVSEEPADYQTPAFPEP